MKTKRLVTPMNNDNNLRPPLPGFRLAKFEVFNWGTFDGKVYSVEPRGETTLLVGENGSGKSTLVDALLTLLVQPKTRNYNVAAGATKNERDERSYIRGAYDRTIGDGGRPQVQYLRPPQGYYSALLACFENAARKKSFTLCQVLFLDAEGRASKVYAFADGERSIVEDLGNLSGSRGMVRQLSDKGFKATESYKEYFNWLQKATGFRSKAMDIFNQTVAVKDVQRLDLFIRQHMLERKAWDERVGQLLKHFSELIEAHQLLLKVRLQAELLRPIREEGERYRLKAQEANALRELLTATPYYFALERIALLKPLCISWRQDLLNLHLEIERLAKLKEELDRSITRLELEIEQAGGDRLRSLPGLIEQQAQLSKIKKSQRIRFEAWLETAGIQKRANTHEQFHQLRLAIEAAKERWIADREEAREELSRVQFEKGSLQKRIGDDRDELAALEKRKGNLPESLIMVRERMCRDLKLSPTDLPFAAELIAVDPDEREWEESIEMVLNSFARSLLVSREHYLRVSGYVNQTRLVDGRGQGQRLVYLKVDTSQDVMEEPRKRQTGPVAFAGNTLGGKLNFRPEHSLIPWLKGEILRQYNYAACETIEEFQRTVGAAMTKERHVKSGPYRHEKNDRNASGDRRNYVLGWDNRQKREALAEALRTNSHELNQLDVRTSLLNQRIDLATKALSALDQATETKEFDDIDYDRHDFEISQLRMEKERLEQSNDTVKELKRKCEQLREESIGYQADRDDGISKKAKIEAELRVGELQLGKSEDLVDRIHASPSQRPSDEVLEQLRNRLPEKFDFVSMASLPDQTERKLRFDYEQAMERIKPAERELLSSMMRFLRKFPDEQTDIDASIDSLESFEALEKRIAYDDLPKHEERFKHRLNEKVLHEIGLLNAGLEADRQEIRDKVYQLNEALKLLEWKKGTFMQLETSDSTDREIQDFRRDLTGCLSNTFEDTAEVNELTFTRIQKLVEKLRDDNNSRWREKVIDVRNWFNFAAREIVRETGEGRSYYDGGTGQSGGEKGKLAFLVLVAAIAYQYDLDPNADESDRFHFVVVDEMFSRSDDQHAEYALQLFDKFRLQLLIVAPLDAKARVTEPYVGTYLHVLKNKDTHRSELISVTAEDVMDASE
jgi:uncharacterized protein YPO0396